MDDSHELEPRPAATLDGQTERRQNLNLLDQLSARVRYIPEDPDIGKNSYQRELIDARLRRKIDWKLMPWLCIMYLMSFLDRTNISSAKLAGLEVSLGDDPSNSYYSLALASFFIGYAAFVPISNVLIKKIGPPLFLPTIMILWGACMLSMGFVNSWTGLVVARFFLGVTESGLFPGVCFYLSCWYKRDEFGKRAGIFFASAALAGSFGGLLTSGILSGEDNWQLIFIIDGAITIVLGLASYWMVHPFPEKVRFLSSRDHARLIRRLKLDKQRSADPEAFEWMYLFQAVTDTKTFLAMMAYMGCLMPLYAFSLFLPEIIHGLFGVSGTVEAQLLITPPYTVAAAATLGVAFLSDMSRKRGAWILGMLAVAVAGFAVLATASLATTAAGSMAAQYIGAFLAAAGIYPMIPLNIAWIANNTEGVYKRGVVLGLVIGWGNLNGVVSSYLYSDKATYGHAIAIAWLVVFGLGGTVLMMRFLKGENKKRIDGRRADWVVGKSDLEIEEMGDRRPDFIYTV